MKKILIYIILVASFGFLSSCEDNLSDLNINPDRSPTANPQEVLTAALGYTSWIVDGQFNRSSFMWAQYLTWGPGVAVGEIERNIVNGADFDNVWNRSYANALADLEFIKNSEANAHAGVAQILQAYLFQALVDHFGDVPFTEALKGDIEGNFAPAFDDDKAIYEALIPMIDEGIDKLTSTTSTVGDEDLVFRGNLDGWIKFANSLKLRILMRQSLVNPDVAGAVQEIINNGNLIESSADIVSVPAADVAGDQNPMYAVMESGVGNFYIASSTSFDHLVSLNDPRLDAFYSPSPNAGTHVAILQGSIDDEPFTNSVADYSQMGSVPYAADAEVILMSDWEVWFLRAEAAERFNTSDDAATAYANAITANFRYLEVEGAADYIASRDYANQPNKINEIGEQKWISMNGLQESEGWIESRRFNHINESILVDSKISVLPSGVFPSIWYYPADEIAKNPNAPSQRTDVTEKVFWDN